MGFLQYCYDVARLLDMYSAEKMPCLFKIHIGRCEVAQDKV